MLCWRSVKLRAVVVALLASCGPGPEPVAPREPIYEVPPPVDPLPRPSVEDPGQVGHVVDRSTEFKFEGGSIELELHQDGDRVVQVARNHYAAPVMVHWDLTSITNLEPTGETTGAALLPAAPTPRGNGPAVALAELRMMDIHANYHRDVAIRARFGDPHAQPTSYAYAVPYARGLIYTVLQGFHGPFSHRGSNEYAVDFQCPVATPVMAARDGTVVAVNAAAQGSGTTPEFLDYKRVNFVLVQHDDGTIGEYLHLSPERRRGQARAARLSRPGARAVRLHRLLVDAPPALPGHDCRRRRHRCTFVPVGDRRGAGQERGARPGSRLPSVGVITLF